MLYEVITPNAVESPICAGHVAAGKVFMIRNQINAKSATLYAANTRILYSTKRFYETYIKIVLKAMVSAKYRKYLWIRLSNSYNFV